MAKKTKQIKATKIADPILYEGQVSLQFQNKGVKGKKVTFKNNGCRLLFQGICRFLLKMSMREDNVATALNIDRAVPNFLAIGSEERITQTDPIFDDRLKAEMDIGSRFDIVNRRGPITNVSDSSIRAEFTATIPYTSVGSRNITEMGLCSTSTIGDPSMLARIITVNDDFPDGITIPPGQNVIVNWQIIFRNL
jgi:hypothetical protein